MTLPRADLADASPLVLGPLVRYTDDTTSCVEFDRPHRVALQARGWPAGEARVELDVEPEGAGSLITMREDASHGPGRLVPGPLRQLAIGPRNRESLRRLVLLAEGRRR